jgi:hypothetical protein
MELVLKHLRSSTMAITQLHIALASPERFYILNRMGFARSIPHFVISGHKSLGGIGLCSFLTNKDLLRWNWF